MTETNNTDKCQCKCISERDSLYFYWREVQRKQIGISSNIIFLFASAILGFTANNALSKCKHLLLQIDVCVLVSSISFLILSLFLYVIFSLNRLYDFRKTAKLFKSNKSIKEIQNETKNIGERTWLMFYGQLTFLLIGFVFTLIFFFRQLI